jgi:glycosyltransferase involved in cell wall biosynthesis
MSKLNLKATPRAIHVVPSLDRADGGLPLAAYQLSDALAKSARYEIELISQLGKNQKAVGTASADFIVEYESVEDTDFSLGLPVKRMLGETSTQSNPNLIHSHGIWNLANHWASLYGRNLKIPYVFSPHGMLEPWALEQSWFKKAVGLITYQRRDLESATLFCATSEGEYNSLRALGYRQPVAVIPNGVAASQQQTMFERRVNDSRRHQLLYLSRIHKKKGIEELIYAWARIRPSNWELVIAGGDGGDGYRQKMINLCESLKFAQSIRFTGEVYGSDKDRLYAEADLFILPSHSENFGLVVAEALSFGLPVITTRATPWGEIANQECGWVIDNDVDSIVSCLNVALNTTVSERKKMGLHATKYAAKFNWDGIALQMADVYDWVLGNAAMPGCIRLN